jgi:hypothetical protein
MAARGFGGRSIRDLRFPYDFSQSTVVAPTVDKFIGWIDFCGCSKEPLQTWFGITCTLFSVIKAGVTPVPRWGRVEGETSAHCLRGASGDKQTLSHVRV